MIPKLPFQISVPHGGRRTPEELMGAVALTDGQILDDADAFTDKLYDVRDIVEEIHIAKIARTFVDLNRSTDQMPPEFPDGLIKSHTSYNVPVYHEGKEPDQEMISTLIRRYYNPYHLRLAQSLGSDRVILMLDCHSMAEYPPPVAPDSTTRRPLVNLGNLDGAACSDRIARSLAGAFVRSFGFTEEDVVLNHPFKGGYITRRYGNNPKPVIQVELNRSLYLDPADPYRENPQRIKTLTKAFSDTISLFFDTLSTGN